MSITTKEYNSFQKAYDFFNGELFSSSLPEVLITLQRKSGQRPRKKPMIGPIWMPAW